MYFPSPFPPKKIQFVYRFRKKRKSKSVTVIAQKNSFLKTNMQESFKSVFKDRRKYQFEILLFFLLEKKLGMVVRSSSSRYY